MESRTSPRPAVAGAWILGLAVTLFATALAGTTAHHDAGSLGAIGALYLLLAAVAWSVAAWLHRSGRLGAYAAGFGVALLLVWQLREATFVPPSLLESVALAALLAPLVRRLLARSRAAGDEGGEGARLLLLAAIAGVAFVAAGVGIFRAMPLARWHLLRHHTLLGTPTHYLLDESVLAVQEELFAAHGLRAPAAMLPAAPPPALASAAPPAAPPHVVFVLLDTLRADTLAPWRDAGSPALMPRLEARAAGAVVLTDLRANASWTRPSMASFFTGLLPEEHGARDTDEALPESCETLAEVFRGAGYATAAIVSNVAALGADAGFAQGFDVYAELDGKPFARAPAVNRHLRAWLARRATDRPSFLYLHYLDAHEPYSAGMPRLRTRDAYRRGYDAELRTLDRFLDEALAEVEQALGPNTLIVVTADHGEEFFEHEHFGHGHSLYRELLHLPAFLWTVADNPGAGAIDARLDSRDVFQLLAGVARGGLPDLRRWAAGRHRARRYASVYYSTEGRLALRPYLARIAQRAVEEDGLELIWSGYGRTLELYDLRRDPAQTRNLAAARPADVERLLPALDAEVRFWTRAEGYRPSPEAEKQMKALGYAD